MAVLRILLLPAALYPVLIHTEIELNEEVSVNVIVGTKPDSIKHLEHLQEIYEATFSLGRTEGSKQLRETLQVAIDSLTNDRRQQYLKSTNQSNNDEREG